VGKDKWVTDKNVAVRNEEQDLNRLLDLLPPVSQEYIYVKRSILRSRRFCRRRRRHLHHRSCRLPLLLKPTQHGGCGVCLRDIPPHHRTRTQPHERRAAPLGLGWCSCVFYFACLSFSCSCYTPPLFTDSACRIKERKRERRQCSAPGNGSSGKPRLLRRMCVYTHTYTHTRCVFAPTICKY